MTALEMGNFKSLSPCVVCPQADPGLKFLLTLPFSQKGTQPLRSIELVSTLVVDIMVCLLRKKKYIHTFCRRDFGASDNFHLFFFRHVRMVLSNLPSSRFCSKIGRELSSLLCIGMLCSLCSSIFGS